MSDYIGFIPGKGIEWMELNLLMKGTSLNKAQIQGLADGIEEQDIDELLTDIDWRSGHYKVPLYQVRNNKVTPLLSWQEVPEYFLCLYYSFHGASDDSGGTALFEKISASALKNYLDGDAISLGFPTKTSFNSHLDNIARLCCEERNMLASSSYKDDGVDVVGYKSFDDGRSSNLYVLLQCAAGLHWTSKKPIPIERWTNYIVWFQKNIIQSISTVEYVKKRHWDKHASTYGMLLDRLRIYNCLYQSEVEQDLRNETLTWCRTKIDEIE
ncbi:MAG: hypothetical protein RIF33_11575 [Cyclobacteriaceae bacterium]